MTPAPLLQIRIHLRTARNAQAGIHSRGANPHPPAPPSPQERIHSTTGCNSPRRRQERHAADCLRPRCPACGHPPHTPEAPIESSVEMSVHRLPPPHPRHGEPPSTAPSSNAFAMATSAPYPRNLLTPVSDCVIPVTVRPLRISSAINGCPIAPLAHATKTFISVSSYFAGTRTGAPLSFTKNTRNFAGSVVLALRPTVCTSSGPSQNVPPVQTLLPCHRAPASRRNL
jgi:hypothetical protein